MQVGANGIDRHLERRGYSVIAAIFLVIEDQNGAFGLRQRQQRSVDGGLQFGVGEELLGGASVTVDSISGQILQPFARFVLVEGRVRRSSKLALAAAALPLVLSHVDDDAVEVCRQRGIPAEVWKGAVEAEKDLLGEVFDVRAGRGHAREGAEDHGLMFPDQRFKSLRRCEVSGHRAAKGSDFRIAQKFQGGD